MTLTDVAQMRVQTISFFLMVLLFSALGVRGIWNSLRSDFPRLPRLSFAKALGLIALWGTLFVLVLTMISGARELMTPGAWKKQGLTYRLDEEPKDPPPNSGIVLEDARKSRLDALRRALWAYAIEHEGRLPPGDDDPAIAPEVWEIPDPSGIHFQYNPGQKVEVGSTIVAYEPGLFGPTRFALLTDGTITLMTLPEIRQALAAGKPQ